MSTNPTNQPKILVTGASGQFGSLVLTHLTQTYGYPAGQIIATSRNIQGLSQWAELGVDVREADFNNPSSLVQSFQGASKVLLISTDSLDNEVRLQQHLNAVAAAKEAGVGHLLYTSLPDAEKSLVSFASVHFGTENAIKASGLKWTILRNSWYFENLVFTIPGAVASGSLYSAAGDGQISYLSRNDLARSAAAALIAESGVEDVTFTLTGTEALDISSVAAQISKALDKPITVIQVPVEAIIEGAKSHGVPEPVAIVFASFDTAAKAGNLSAVTSDVETLTGKAPQSFGDWLVENKGIFG